MKSIHAEREDGGRVWTITVVDDGGVPTTQAVIAPDQETLSERLVRAMELHGFGSAASHLRCESCGRPLAEVKTSKVKRVNGKLTCGCKS
jgi:hypothetical protein